MLRLVERFADACDVAPHARGGLVVHYHDRLDLMGGVGRQRLGNPVDRRRLAPFGVDHLHVEPEALRHLGPQVAELAVARGEHLVAG